MELSDIPSPEPAMLSPRQRAASLAISTGVGIAAIGLVLTLLARLSFSSGDDPTGHWTTIGPPPHRTSLPDVPRPRRYLPAGSPITLSHTLPPSPLLSRIVIPVPDNEDDDPEFAAPRFWGDPLWWPRATSTS